MLAMNFRGPFRVRADRNKSYPEILHPNDAIIRVTRSCICGSDLHLYHGLVPDTTKANAAIGQCNRFALGDQCCKERRHCFYCWRLWTNR